MKRNANNCLKDMLDWNIDNLYSLASEAIVRRGLSYARAGRVIDFTSSPNQIEARIEGGRDEPYLVTLEYDGEEILSNCSCPFDWEPFCKHAIAALAIEFNLLAETTDSPSDLGKLEKTELDRRRKRGHQSGFRIRRREGEGFYGIFDVYSPSDIIYEVEIRSLIQRVNRCSCHDFATATLGTCKHIEAAVAALRKRLGKRAYTRACESPPSIAQLLVDQYDRPRIRLLLPTRPTPALNAVASEYFDGFGYFRRDPVEDLPALLARLRRIRKLIVYGDVIEFSELIASERRARERADQVARKVLGAGRRVAGLRGQLYPYQLEGTAFLASRGRALLGDDMGLGKTIQAIAATRVLQSRGEVDRILVVCPASLKHQWVSEIERFLGVECQVIGGPAGKRMEQYRRRAAFSIVNYELVLRDSDSIAALEPDLIILDEAQRIRNWRTKTAAAIKEIQTPYAFVLTGTPLQNKLDDLYSIMQVVDSRILGPLWAYNHNFVVRGEKGNRIEGYKNLDELRRRIAPAVLRRAKGDVKLQLPKRIDSRLSIELTTRQRDLMDENIATAARYAKIAEKRPLSPKEEKWLFMAMQNARMACDAAGLVDKETVGSPKLDEFEQLIRDLCLDRGRKVIVFSEWETFCRMAAQRAERLGIGFTRLHGGVPTPKRGSLIERFRDDPECLIFFSTDAGGLGLNLQFASTMINLELPWNPAVLDQRIGRIHRHGQTDPVHVIQLVSETSFESGLEKTLLSKRSIFAAALDQKSEATQVEAPSSCLRAVRDALVELESEKEPGQEPVLIEQEQEREQEQTDSSSPVPEESLVKVSPERRLAQLLGPRLEQVVELASGPVVALVDSVDQATIEAAKGLGMIAIESSTQSALEALGKDSLFNGSKVLLDRTQDKTAQNNARHSELSRLAERKLAAARALADANLGAEAIEQAHASMTATLYAISTTNGDGFAEGKPVAQLLYEVLVPRRLLTLEQAAIISRAEGLAQAYTGVTQPVAPEMVRTILADAGELLKQLVDN